MTPVEAERQAALRTARRQTIAAAAIALGGDFVGAIIAYSLDGWDTAESLRAAHAVLALAVLLFLLGRRSASRRAVLASFLLLVVPVLPLLVVLTMAAPESRVMEPFIAQKMVMIGIALLTPESALWGIVLTTTVVAEAVALSVLRLGGGRAGEPWVTLFYGLFAIGLLLHRASERRLAARLVRVSAEAAALERIAGESLAVRDQLNSPLQTLELGLALLRRRASAEDESRIGRLQSALDQLKELSQRLARRAPTDATPATPPAGEGKG